VLRVGLRLGTVVEVVLGIVGVVDNCDGGCVEAVGIQPPLNTSTVGSEQGESRGNMGCG
jgi:hypothetical protein